MTIVFLVVLGLLGAGFVLYVALGLWLAASHRQATCLRSALVQREQFLAEQRLQQLTRSAMQQLLDTARRTGRDDHSRL